MFRRPNIVFVLTDDQGFGDLGCTENPVIQTPNINEFYQESIRFTNFHVGPTCAPTRAGLLTGHYANSTGVWHTIGGRSLLRKNEWTLANALQENGYRTAIFGKWHLGDSYPYRPHDRGFETAVVHGGGGISQTPDYWGNDYFDDTYYVNGETRKFTGYCTDVFFEEAFLYIEEHRDEPFFCYIACNAPHSPYNVDDRYADLYRGRVPEERARFYGMITNIDENFGRMRKKLHELNLEENTIVIFMTDNGTSGGARTDEKGFVIDGYNAGLRGLKNSPYDGGHRVPFILHWPGGSLNQGTDIDELTANVDFMPTLLDLCAVTVPPERHFHGKSVKPLLYGEGEGWEERAMVTDSQRLTDPVKWRQSAVMTNRWRLINGQELYDIQKDWEQKRDLAAEHPEVVTNLRSEYEKWWDIVSQQFKEEIPLSISSCRETVLTCHDWRNPDCSSPWHQGHIRSGMEANGYWEIEVEDDGTFEVELRRWPRSADWPLCAGIEEADIEWSRNFVHEKDWYFYTGGKALPLIQAVLQIGDNRLEKQISAQDKAVTFQVDLEKGLTHLQSWLFGHDGLVLGAYYIYVKKL